ncbi:FMN-binding protein [Roseimaritima ulvae]|uniref:FMN-binding domain protein n=1 Tax=Roseimaritima ulvae TaxID=980254 RepID=A0A5B9QZS7_9BACT|nr:FMN-binding protein [Roseimaritima ulvae]QEG43612.1 FMN-binding domain protein [Roseimaritima ulvae]
MGRSLNITLLIGFLLAVLGSGSRTAAEDLVEFINGTTATGTIKSIRKADKEFDFELTVGSRTFQRVYPFSKVHAVTYQGKRYELTPKPAAEAGKPGSPAKRTKAEVLAIIAAAGETPPDWFESTPLDYPPTLDLSWPLKPPTKGWQSHKNMGQYIWSVINENPGRWRSGIKLIHHCVTLHQDDPVLLARDMNALGSAYFRLLQDYPRAAFWLQQAKPSVSTQAGVHLAECYWRLGNPEMAKAMLRGRSVNLAAIKLLGDMGEIAWALRLAKAYEGSNAEPQANILAADALRSAGRLTEAIHYYQRVVDSKRYRNEEYERRFVARAKESIETIQLVDMADVSKVADGTYRDSSTGYNGKLTVEVVVNAGRMDAVKITNHKEKQFYSALTDTPQQLINNQSVQAIDATSGATITSQAIVNATAKALAKGNQ